MVIAERFHFHRRTQSGEESVTEYVVELKKLARNCNFGQHLEEALRDRLVCGMRSQGVQRRLLAEPDLTLDKALEIALAMEAAEKNMHQLNNSELTVQRVSACTEAIQKWEKPYFGNFESQSNWKRSANSAAAVL